MIQAEEKAHLSTEEATPGPVASQWSGSAREHAVQRMFTGIARFYDLNNSILSFGLHHLWKRRAVSFVPRLEAGQAIDIGAGTADLALLFEGRMGNKGRILATDLNLAMLKEGQAKILKQQLQNRITCLRANAEHLGFGDNIFDAATTGFCMRNVGNLPVALLEIQRILKPGGRFICLEFSRPVPTWLRRLYDWYSFTLLPWIGTKVAGDHTRVYEYLPASIRNFPDQERFATLLREAGFQQVEYHNLTGGIVAIHVATK